MSPRFGDSTPLLKLELKRADVSELIAADPVLSSAPLVKVLGAAALAKGSLRRYPDKVVLMQQGDPGHSLFFVMAGEVRLFARRDRDSAELGFARRGDTVGEGEALSGVGGRQCSAMAQGQVEIVELPRELLLVAGRVPPALGLLFQDVHARRLEALDEMSDFLNRW